jgi:tRNA dimethylallyltransferase
LSSGNETEPALLALFGPTSAGKTELAIELSLWLRDRLGLDPLVVSADSRQVYRRLDIGTSKVTKEEARGIPHRLIDVVEPVRKLELESYVERAREAIDRSRAEGGVPFVVGGTGVYVNALVEGWELAGDEAARAELRRDFPPGSEREAHELLERLDRARAKKIHPNNLEATLNALAAVMAGSGRSGAPGGAGPSLVLGLDPGPKEVSRRIELTLDRQLGAGLVEEVVALAERYDLEAEFRRHGARSRNQTLQTLHYREFFEFAARRGKQVRNLSREDLLAVRTQMLENTRAYARRQRSWFSKLPEPTMVGSAADARRAIERYRSGSNGPLTAG